MYHTLTSSNLMVIHRDTSRTMVKVVGSLILLGVLVLLATGYKDGARTESCYDMLTNHSSISGPDPPMDCGDTCQFSIEVIARVDEDSRERLEENITAYECDAVYEGN